MENLIKELEKEILYHNPSFRNLLGTGLSKDEIDLHLNKLPFKISDDIYYLYEWINGTDYKAEILPSGYLLSLEEAVNQFETIYAMKEELQEIFYEQYFDCFRFLSDMSDSGYSFGSLEPPCNGQIIGLGIHHNSEIAFKNLSDLLETAIICYQRGVYRKDDIHDFELYFKIGKELNPDLKYWSWE